MLPTQLPAGPVACSMTQQPGAFQSVQPWVEGTEVVDITKTLFPSEGSHLVPRPKRYRGATHTMPSLLC